jgi:hypothetical protein
MSNNATIELLASGKPSQALRPSSNPQSAIRNPQSTTVLAAKALKKSSSPSSAKAARARARCCTCSARSTLPTPAKSTLKATGSTTCPPSRATCSGTSTSA